MGDRLGTPGAVGITFLFCFFTEFNFQLFSFLVLLKISSSPGVLLRIIFKAGVKCTNVYSYFGNVIKFSYWMNDEAGETQEQYLHD